MCKSGQIQENDFPRRKLEERQWELANTVWRKFLSSWQVLGRVDFLHASFCAPKHHRGIFTGSHECCLPWAEPSCRSLIFSILYMDNERWVTPASVNSSSWEKHMAASKAVIHFHEPLDSALSISVLTSATEITVSLSTVMDQIAVLLSLLSSQFQT